MKNKILMQKFTIKEEPDFNNSFVQTAKKSNKKSKDFTNMENLSLPTKRINAIG